MEITESSGNVFEDLNLSDADKLLAEAMRSMTKRDLNKALAKSLENNDIILINISKA